MNNWISTEHFQGTVQDFCGIHADTKLNDYEQKVRHLCDAWLKGADTFSFHTSGSTGIPKSISFTRNQLEASALTTQQALKLKSGDTALVSLDVSLIAGAMMIIRSLVIGMNMVIKLPSSNPLERNDGHVDFMAIVPYQLSVLLESEKNKLDAISTVIVGGATLSPDTIQLLQSLKTAFYATYGMTETITHVALQRLNGPNRSETFELLQGNHAHLDERGCLVIQTPYLSEQVVTNDCVQFTDDRHFHWLGRIDRVINSGGLKIQAEEVETVVASAFHRLGINRRYLIAGSPDNKFGEVVTLLIEGNPLDTITVKKMQDILSEKLTKTKQPRIIQYLDVFPETPSQKIDRLAALRLIRS